MTTLHALEDEPEKGTRWRRFALGLVIAFAIQAGVFLWNLSDRAAKEEPAISGDNDLCQAQAQAPSPSLK